jgi:hypothetical protein
MNPCHPVRRRCSALGFFLFLFAGVVHHVEAQEGYWDSRFWIPEFSLPVRTAIDSSDRLILAGNKLGILGSFQNSLGRWDGRRWEILRFTVERSLDLENWEAIATNTPANPAEVFVDGTAQGNPRGFFRAASEP